MTASPAAAAPAGPLVPPLDPYWPADVIRDWRLLALRAAAAGTPDAMLADEIATLRARIALVPKNNRPQGEQEAPDTMLTPPRPTASATPAQLAPSAAVRAAAPVPAGPPPGGGAFDWRQYRQLTERARAMAAEAAEELYRQRAALDAQIADAEGTVRKLGRVLALLGAPADELPCRAAPGVPKLTAAAVRAWADAHGGEVVAAELARAHGLHANRVNGLFFGRHGLVARGEFERVGTSVYRRVVPPAPAAGDA